eukprot:6331856-Prymnesium_polylepis.1
MPRRRDVVWAPRSLGCGAASHAARASAPRTAAAPSTHLTPRAHVPPPPSRPWRHARISRRARVPPRLSPACRSCGPTPRSSSQRLRARPSGSRRHRARSRG